MSYCNMDPSMHWLRWILIYEIDLEIFIITATFPCGQWLNSLRLRDAYSVSELTTTGSDNGLSSGRCQTIIWTNAGILLIGPLGTNFSEILIKINIFSFKKTHLIMSSVKRRPFCLCLNVLIARSEMTDKYIYVSLKYFKVKSVIYIYMYIYIYYLEGLVLYIYVYYLEGLVLYTNPSRTP